MHKIVLLLITISTLWSIAIVIDAGDAACSLAMDFDDSNTGMQGDRQKRLFHKFEQEAISKGWKRLNLEIDGRQRQLLFKAPGRNWKNGVIITFHGGGGSYSNFSANLPIGKPMVDFAEMALEEG
ncbi:MAG: hypothetical protein K8F91_18225, partial [Candidatus Obscuribacterales bacterium]|nr:hypothetical protein [Candidatus Obscuribacterales bacterium]